MLCLVDFDPPFALLVKKGLTSSSIMNMPSCRLKFGSKLTFRALALRQRETFQFCVFSLRRKFDTFRPLGCQIFVRVRLTRFSVPHRHSTTVSLETKRFNFLQAFDFPQMLFLWLSSSVHLFQIKKNFAFCLVSFSTIFSPQTLSKTSDKC